MTRISHHLIFISGWLFFGLGAVGVLLPVLPTTPFMLLAATCFAKTSPRFHSWLLKNKVFGSLIKNWQQEEFIEIAAKRRALVIIAVTFWVSIFIVQIWALRLMLICFWMACTFFMARLPTVPLSRRKIG